MAMDEFCDCAAVDIERISTRSESYLDCLVDESRDAFLVTDVHCNGCCVAAGLVDFAGYGANC